MKIWYEPTNVGHGRLVAEDGRDLLIQIDTDLPGIANAFGWDKTRLQMAVFDHSCDEVTHRMPSCQHNHTDGTVDCPDCGIPAKAFITGAQSYLDECAGTEVEDPGYFDKGGAS